MDIRIVIAIAGISLFSGYLIGVLTREDGEKEPPAFMFGATVLSMVLLTWCAIAFFHMVTTRP
jgi:hypothetical protein